MARKAIALFLINDFVVIKIGGVTMGKGDPMIERQLWFKGNTQMKFADQCCAVSGIFQDDQKPKNLVLDLGQKGGDKSSGGSAR